MEFFDVVFSPEFLATQVGLAAAVLVVTQGFKMVVSEASDLAVRICAFVTGVGLALGVSVGFGILAPLALVSAALNGALVSLAVMKGVEMGKHGVGATYSE